MDRNELHTHLANQCAFKAMDFFKEKGLDLKTIFGESICVDLGDVFEAAIEEEHNRLEK